MSTNSKLNVRPTTEELRPIQLSRLTEIRVREVMENDLTDLDASAEDERNAQSLFTLSLGIFIPLIPAWPADGSSATRIGVHAAATFTFGIMAIYFFLVARAKRRKREAIVDRVKQSPVRDMAVSDANASPQLNHDPQPGST